MRSRGSSKISASEASPMSTSSVAVSDDTLSALGPANHPVSTGYPPRCWVHEVGIAVRDPPLLTPSPGQPFVADCEGAGVARIGRIVALDHPRGCPPQLTVSRTGKVHLQEFGDRQIGFRPRQGLVKPTRMRK